MPDNFKALREQIRKKLQEITPESRALSSHDIAVKVINNEKFISSRNIACYIPIENEVDTWPIIRTIWEQRKNCYIPAFSPRIKHLLCFVDFVPGDLLLHAEKHRISEPKIVPEKILAPEKLDMVIVPLTCFNSSRFRIGRGAGCYDRTFAFKMHSEVSFDPYLIGVGYKIQQTEFDPNSWDVPMDEIVTE